MQLFAAAPCHAICAVDIERMPPAALRYAVAAAALRLLLD